MAVVWLWILARALAAKPVGVWMRSSTRTCYVRRLGESRLFRVPLLVFLTWLGAHRLAALRGRDVLRRKS